VTTYTYRFHYFPGYAKMASLCTNERRLTPDEAWKEARRLGVEQGFGLPTRVYEDLTLQTEVAKPLVFSPVEVRKDRWECTPDHFKVQHEGKTFLQTHAEDQRPALVEVSVVA
jgi:hypothetical protein